jgi:hypothetical protein
VSALESFLFPVGLILSPMMVNGPSSVIVISLLELRNRVFTLLPYRLEYLGGWNFAPASYLALEAVIYRFRIRLMLQCSGLSYHLTD